VQIQQFINIINEPDKIEASHLSELEVFVNEYPFFESAHLLYAKGLHKFQSINYSKQLRKTAIVVNSRSVLYELIHSEPKVEPIAVAATIVVEEPIVKEPETVTYKVVETIEQEETEKPKDVSPITITNNDIKVVYINTVTSSNSVVSAPPAIEPNAIEPVFEESENEEIDIVKSIENITEAPVQEFNEEKLNKSIEQEISKGIVQSYIETDILKTTELHKEEKQTEPTSFTDWLKTIQKESNTNNVSVAEPVKPKEDLVEPEIPKIIEELKEKSSVFTQKKQLIDKIIESDPGRIKLGNSKFFTPVTDAKQSLLENEHLVTETLAKIYALQGNISKAIRSYEILSLKFPQKSVYFATLIEKLKNK
jgi:hypothetical protein